MTQSGAGTLVAAWSVAGSTMPSNRLLTAASLVVLSVFFQACAADSSPSGTDGPGGQTFGSNTSDPGESGSGSGDTTTSGTTSSTGTTAAGSATTTDTVQTCISACEAKYPKGAQIGKGIDQCWSKSCPKECSDIGTGTVFSPKNGSCQNPVSTPSAACSQCTVNRCCSAWDACFDDTQCSALNSCSIACYK
ncbi:MAG: hypothetical protein JWP87_4820 [Labilithrix sp.]|nr:hypothetical protein [Labilithrix sp.]